MGITSHRTVLTTTPADTAQQKAMQEVARTILETPIGGRLPNISQMRANVGVGAGTMQKAIQEIQQSGKVELSSKQRQGTILMNRKIGALWSTANLSPLTVLLPLPNSWEFQGLATGLRREIQDRGIPTTFLYGHGSRQRIEALRSGAAQVSVMSNGAAQHWTKTDTELVTHTVLPSGSYYAAESVLVMAREPRDQLPKELRIGIDRQSTDHAWLTEMEFPKHQYVDVSYAQIPSALTRGIIDAAVWHRTALGLSLDDQGLVAWPLERSDALQLSDDISSTGLVIHSIDAVTREVLSEMNIDKVDSLQRGVVAGDVLPLY